MAPIFKQTAKKFKDTAVFVKIDTNAQYELSSRYQIRSLPTFQFFVGGQKADQAVGGIGEAGLVQATQKVVRQAELENVLLTVDNLKAYYAEMDPSKDESDVLGVHKKCVDMTKKYNKEKQCVGASANQLARRLRQKYKKAPKLIPRYDPDASKSKAEGAPKEEKASSSSSSSSSTRERKPSAGSSTKPNLHLATKEDLMKELERRLDEERDQQVEDEDADEEEMDPDFHKWSPGDFPERVVVVGGGPAG